MRIDLEQFLAIAVGLGAAGAVGLGIYSVRSGSDEVVEAVETVEAEAASAEPSEPASAAVVPLPPAPAAPIEDEPLSPVVPDADPLEAYGPEAGVGGVGWGGGPDVETPDW